MIDPGLPLIDLHRHLDGNVRLGTILELARQHDVSLPAYDLEGLRPYVQVTAPPPSAAPPGVGTAAKTPTLPGVMAFIAKFRWMTAVLVDCEACRRVAYENVEDAVREGLDYVELRFSPWFMAETHGLDPHGVVEAVVDGVETAAKHLSLPVGLIGIISRTYGPVIGERELQALLHYRDHLVALDLAGDEANWPGELFVEHFRRARSVGWQITVHAGESVGPASIWQALRGLGATRIGHAVAAAGDPALLDHLAERQIGIESSLTSNVQTSTVPDYASHPIRQFMSRGLLVTLNTDDPGISAIDLRHEYDIAAPAAGLTPEQIHQAQHNALSVAFLSPEAKTELASSKAARQASGLVAHTS